MCVHRLYIYTVCGHSIFSPQPTALCVDAGIPPNGSFSTTCDLIAHPYQSWRLHSLCTTCENTRARLMHRIEVNQAIAYEEVKWKVSYGMPTHGLDFWGKKAQERERAEKEVGGKKKRRSVRFSFRRGRRASKGEGKGEGEVHVSAASGGSSVRSRVTQP